MRIFLLDRIQNSVPSMVSPVSKHTNCVQNGVRWCELFAAFRALDDADAVLWASSLLTILVGASFELNLGLLQAFLVHE